MYSANHTVGILAQLQLAKLHAQRVDQQEPANQGIAGAQDQLDGLSCLNDSNQPGQDSQQPAFRARGYKSWRRRFRIQAAVARTVFAGDQPCLAFQTQDETIPLSLSANLP